MHLLTIIGSTIVLAAIVCESTCQPLQAQQYFRPKEHIVLPNEPKIEEHPYHVVFINSESFSNYKCAGAILSPSVVVTTGDCAKYLNKMNTKVQAGTDELFAPVVKHNISRITIHPKFKTFGGSYAYNIALITLEEPLIFSEKIQAIELPTRIEYLGSNFEWGLVSGFGPIKPTNNYEYDLHSIDLPIVDQEYCKNIFKEKGEIDHRVICAGYINVENKDICLCDLGSPLVAVGKLHGLSLGDCATENKPQVFTRVASYRDWIRSEVNL